MNRALALGLLAFTLGCGCSPDGEGALRYRGAMVTIPAGEGIVGDLTGSGRKDESPARTLRFARSFAVGKYEVTNADYAEFVAATGRAAPSHWTDGQCPDALRTHAVTHVTWDDAQAYCKWAGVRLLTEAEWEYVARGNTRWTWPWGDQFLDSMANVRFDASVRQTPVGSNPKGCSVFGVEDLAGGVWEWVADAYDEERWARVSDGAIADACSKGEGRVLKGGAWTLAPELSRIAARDRTNADAKGLMIGFRVARDVE